MIHCRLYRLENFQFCLSGRGALADLIFLPTVMLKHQTYPQKGSKTRFINNNYVKHTWNNTRQCSIHQIGSKPRFSLGKTGKIMDFQRISVIFLELVYTF